MGQNPTSQKFVFPILGNIPYRYTSAFINWVVQPKLSPLLPTVLSHLFPQHTEEFGASAHHALLSVSHALVLFPGRRNPIVLEANQKCGYVKASTEAVGSSHISTALHRTELGPVIALTLGIT